MTSSIINPFFYLVFALPVILFFLTPDRIAFFLYILIVIGTVFSLLSMAFLHTWSSTEQTYAIAIHFSLLLHLFSLYSLSKYVFYLRTDNLRLNKRLSELKEYVIDDRVLSRREFEKQSDIIKTSMARKQESGFMVKMDLSRMNKHTIQPAMLSLADITYETLRKHFDLTGQYDQSTIIFLVQNTNKDGLDILTKRIKFAFLTKFEPEILDQIDWEIIAIHPGLDLK
ncbi:MAG: hypothetical protein R3250_13040 [Melioribacteraceae bacterium]|nr:hypothetical protein [Melioribacteraceae bacterium]